ncbi:MAG TPA: 23S rRNA (guanosine(2251)-2'-O)-methyltransferase RlmB [Crenotrichaceae bacterium]|nr:23S rRNA (guanosine(2251)-2'-O)-methyltransferase RlmB [Crenotrichaceae bacterium]
MTNHLIASGFHAVQTVLDWDPQRINNVWVDKNRSDTRIRSVLQQLSDNNISVEYADKHTLDRLSENSNHQGIVVKLSVAAMLTENELLSLLENINKPPLLLILDQIQDPHNFGACLRTADAAGVDAVIIAKDNSVGFTPTVLKTSSGALDYVPVCRVTNLCRTIKTIQKKGVWVVGASDDGDQSIHDADLQGAVAIVMGSEHSGMRRLVRKACDFIVNIPMLGRVESLNVSVATGVVLYEVLRQRQNKPERLSETNRQTRA